MTLAGTRQLRSQGSVSVHAHCTEGVTGSEGREGANGVGIEVGGGNGDGNGVGVGNGDVNGNWDGDGAETGTGGRRVGERKMRAGTGAGTERE